MNYPLSVISVKDSSKFWPNIEVWADCTMGNDFWTLYPFTHPFLSLPSRCSHPVDPLPNAYSSPAALLLSSLGGRRVAPPPARKRARGTAPWAGFHLFTQVIQWYWFVSLILTFYKFAHMYRLHTRFWLSEPVLSTLLSLPCLPWKSGICAAEEAKQRIMQDMPESDYLDREECYCWSWCGNCMHIPNFFF